MNFLLSKLILNHTQTHDPSVRTAYGKFSSIFGILCNILLFAAKLIAGLLTGSLSITADAVNNLSDASSSIISLMGFKLSSRPADEEHPFGHGRYEYLAGLIVSFIVLLIGFELIKNSIDKILHPTEIVFLWLSPVILLVSILVKFWMMSVNRRIGKLIQSQALIAAAADSRNDVISTSAVLLSTLISYFTDLQLDGWMGMLVALFILYSGIGLIRETMDPLLGSSPDQALVESIQQLVMSYPGVLGTHDLMVHDYGPGRQFASIHVEMAAEADVLASHDVIDTIEQDLLQQLGIHTVIHFDPISTTSPLVQDLRHYLSEKVKTIDSRLTIHDLRIVPGPTHTNVIFDCVVPHDFNMSDMELKSAISKIVSEQSDSYRCVITFDHSFVSIQR